MSPCQLYYYYYYAIFILFFKFYYYYFINLQLVLLLIFIIVFYYGISFKLVLKNDSLDKGLLKTTSLLHKGRVRSAYASPSPDPHLWDYLGDVIDGSVWSSLLGT